MKNAIVIISSLLIVAFGQPAWSWVLALLASTFGYTLFWKALLDYPSWKERFRLSFFWFTAVQLIQLSWMISHPFLYILIPYIILSVLMGLQFGLIGALITPFSIRSFRRILGISALWVLCEWSRLFVFSGFSWNMSGLAYAGSDYALQFASLGGVFALSFWVFLVNLLALRKSYALFTLAALTPFAYGAVQIHKQEKKLEKAQNFHAVLVQPSFPCEATLTGTPQEMINCVLEQWKKILTILKKHQGKQVDLIVLPEYFVPFGTYTFVYEHAHVVQAFKDVLGEEAVQQLPKQEDHLAYKNYLNNAFWMQSLANIFQASVVGGLEDVEENSNREREHFSSAQYFTPQGGVPNRYDKRVLMPLGEYIPFGFLKQLAASYGVHGTFVPGQKAKVFEHSKLNFGTSICYEELFGHLMRENSQKGAQLLVNLSNDAWFPQSKLSRQHFEHARLRTVENGIPLIRACNTGVTSAVDSLGRPLAVLGSEEADPESLSDSVYVSVPIHSYSTPYSRFGDTPIIAIAFMLLLLLV